MAERSRTFHLARVMSAVRALGALIADMRQSGQRVGKRAGYDADAAVVLAARMAWEDARPYLEDFEGRVRL
jgi:predicted component of type VI protein secretion system